MSKSLKIAMMSLVFMLFTGVWVHASYARTLLRLAPVSDELSEIPEPTSLLLVGTGLAGLVLKKKVRK